MFTYFRDVSIAKNDICTLKLNPLHNGTIFKLFY